MAPKVAAADGRPSEWSADPDAPIPFVFGLRGLAGQIVHRDTFGPDNRYQGIVTVYSGAGPVNGYGDFRMDSVVKTFTGEQMDGTPAKLWRQTRLGAQPDTALTSPASLPSAHTMSGWTSAHKLSGKACSMITLFQDGDFRRWQTGEPNVIQEVQGLLCYDPRLDSTWPGGSGSCRLATRSTWVYSTNGAIHALNWALGMKENSILVGGIGASIAAIDVDALIAAANVADTNGWTCSAVAYSLDDKFQVYAGLLQAAGAIPARKAGKISCVSRGAAPASVVTISADDTAGPFEFLGGAPREGRINTAVPRCVSSTHDWEMVDLAPVSNSTYVTEDGNATRSRGIDYAYVSDEDQAAQLARYDIADSREGITGTISLKPYLRDLDPGDCFTITEDGFAMSGQKCLVLSRSFDPASGLVQVTFRSETNAKHAWALAGTGTLPSTPSLGFTDPATVATPDVADWSAVAGSGAAPTIVLTGAVPSSVTISKVVVEYKTSVSSVWIPWVEAGPDTAGVDITGLEGSTSYDVGVTYRNAYGVAGSRLTLAAITTGAATVSGLGDLAYLNTVTGTEIDLAAVDTPQLVDEAATVADTQIQRTGYGGAGRIAIDWWGGSKTTFTQLDSYAFSYDGVGSITLQWTGLIQWKANAARVVKIWACVDTPTVSWNGSAYQDFEDTWDYEGNQNALTSQVVATINVTGLSVGTHTLSIWAQSDTNGGLPVLDYGSVTTQFASKK